jgi:uncharacterized protein YegL
MRGESIHSVNVGIQAMLSALRQDPYALESVHISIITYDNGAREFIPLTPLEDFQFSDIVVPSAGGTFTGAALEWSDAGVLNGMYVAQMVIQKETGVLWYS